MYSTVRPGPGASRRTTPPPVAGNSIRGGRRPGRWPAAPSSCGTGRFAGSWLRSLIGSPSSSGGTLLCRYAAWRSCAISTARRAGQAVDPPGQLVDSVAVTGERGRAVVGVRTAGGQALQERPGVPDGNPQLAERSDLADQPHIVLVVVPVSVGQPAGGDQPQRFVVAHRFGGYPSMPCQFTDLHAVHLINVGLAPGGQGQVAGRHPLTMNATSAWLRRCPPGMRHGRTSILAELIKLARVCPWGISIADHNADDYIPIHRAACRSMGCYPRALREGPRAGGMVGQVEYQELAEGGVRPRVLGSLRQVRLLQGRVGSLV